MNPSANPLPSPPSHRKSVRQITKFGLQREDTYAWMKPQDWQRVLRDPTALDAEIKKAIDGENAYTKACLAGSCDLSTELTTELRALTPHANAETGCVVDGVFYFERMSDVGEIIVGCRDLKTGQERVLLNMAQERLRHPAARLSWQGPRFSPNRSVLGWAVDNGGSGSYGVKVCDVATGELLVDDLNDCHGGFAFDKSGRYLYWVGRDDKGRAKCVWRRDLLDGSDYRCFESEDRSYFIDLKTSQSGDFVFVSLLNSDQSETWAIGSDAPTGSPSLIEPMSKGHYYDVEHWGEQFVIRTNSNNAEDFRLVSAPIETPGKEHWQTFVEHLRGRYITQVIPFQACLVRFEWREAKPRIVLMARDGSEHDIEFPDPAYALRIEPAQDYSSDAVYYQFSSPISPWRLMKTAFSSRRTHAVSTGREILDFENQHLRLSRLEMPAADGAQIPVTLVSRASSPPSPTQPLYLFAYGAYGDVTEAEFRPEAIALVERGWTFAIAHVRGGGERGAHWWRPTLKRGKKTTFSDFTTCAETLIARGMAGARNIVAHGMSAGGLVMGSVFATHPHLWAGVIAQVPFVDILNTLDDWENHPLGSTPFANWGDPRLAEDYHYMASYSPYDTLKPANYPALLATGGVADDRVAFWEPLKFVAKARELNRGNATMLAKIDLLSGHLGDPSPEGQLQQTSLFLTFATRAVETALDERPPQPELPAVGEIAEA